MVVLWLVGLIGVGIIFIGLRFLLDPAAGAIGFGVPVHRLMPTPICSQRALVTSPLVYLFLLFSSLDGNVHFPRSSALQHSFRSAILLPS
jgi:hypothetical protein